MNSKNSITDRMTIQLRTERQKSSANSNEVRTSSSNFSSVSREDTIGGERRPATTAALPSPSPIRPLAIPRSNQREHYMMEMPSTIPKKEKIKIKDLALHELLRGRPLLILTRPDAAVSSHLPEKKHWVSGFDFGRAETINLAPGEQYVNWKLIYQIEGCLCSVFYGPNNTSTMSFRLSELQRHDRTGTLIESILGINSPGSFRGEEAEGMGLLAACIGAGFFGFSTKQEAHKVLSNLSLQDRSECLRHALILSCYEDSPHLVDELFRLGANPNVTSMDDESMPLEIAILRDNIGLVKTLLAQGANPDIELTSGATCRGLAKMLNNEQALSLINALKKSDADGA